MRDKCKEEKSDKFSGNLDEFPGVVWKIASLAVGNGQGVEYSLFAYRKTGWGRGPGNGVHISLGNQAGPQALLGELPLPICGILSDKSVEKIGSRLCRIRSSLQSLGYCNPNPIMSLGTLGLPVSPALKLTDKGLVDVKEGKLVPLIVTE